MSQFQSADDGRLARLVMEVGSWKLEDVLGSFRLCGSAAAGPRDGVFW